MNEFKFLQSKSLNDASEFLKNNPDNSLLYAGGTDALGLIKDKIYNPVNVMNLKSVPDLNKINYTPQKGLTIGALVRIEEIADSKIIQKKFTVLAEAASEVATPQLRNMGTIGGNICQRPRCWYFRGDFNCLKKGGDECFAVQGENKYHCIIGGGPCYIVHPSDLAVALLALGAEISIYSNEQTRTVPVEDFFILPEDDLLKEHILEPGEIVTSIFVPDPENGIKSSYIKIKERSTWDFAVVSMASVIKGNSSQLKKGRIAFGGIAPKPWIDTNLNNALSGFRLNGNNINSLSNSILNEADPLEKNEYKLMIAKKLLKKMLLNLINV